MTTKKQTDTYQRRFENRSMRPYYSVAISVAYYDLLPKWTGFRYEKMIHIVSDTMSNAAYFEVQEMEQATQHFAKIWKDKTKTKTALEEVRRYMQNVIPAEDEAWKTDWSSLPTESLLEQARLYYELASTMMSRFILSQPQHVVSLDERISKLLEGYENRDELLRAATYVKGDLPWAEEEREIAKLHGEWKGLNATEQERTLQELVKKYGWLNAVEGDALFDAEHYRRKIESFQPSTEQDFSQVKVPDDIYELGQLIGELGWLRFWGRSHWMQLRYHLKCILLELTARSQKPELEFATVEEVVNYFSQKDVDLEEISRRKNGYVIYTNQGKPTILTDKKADEMRKYVLSTGAATTELKGRVANKGKAKGRVRIISFSASDYQEQVDSFKQGEILVTGMTRPQIVHLCRKAAAIVTDEGGITSHAAVISRELNVPCVIGTHNATNVLKTGDEVEVDAEIGIIRIL